MNCIGSQLHDSNMMKALERNYHMPIDTHLSNQEVFCEHDETDGFQKNKFNLTIDRLGDQWLNDSEIEGTEDQVEAQRTFNQDTAVLAECNDLLVQENSKNVNLENNTVVSGNKETES